ncbi:unnamed protein product [Scytosiphon promiscuus]
MDSLDVVPKQSTFAPGVDYMTDYDSWLDIQNGAAPDSPEEMDSEKRYIRNARDLARLVATDTIWTEAFRGALVLMDQGAFSRGGANGPYADSTRQRGFVDFGVSHLMKTFASLELSQKSSWYQKWNVHLFARPEAVAGTLHNVMNGLLDVELDASLVDNEELLGRVAAHNAVQNEMRIGIPQETYLLSQATAGGSPAHPSYPAGHAVQNGAFGTVLKAFVGLERGGDCFSNPMYPDDDGMELLDWDGECLTYEGEINKLTTNVAFGRQMMGVHYRFDSHEGIIQGETIAVRRLHQELVGLPEDHFYEFHLFTGETIKLDHDGKFYIDGNLCSGAAFTGVDNC